MEGLKRGLEYLRYRQELIDVQVRARGTVFDCHSLILAAMSVFFRHIFITYEHQDRRVIHLADMADWVFRDVLDFMYTGVLHITGETYEPLLRAAEFLQMPSFIQYLKDWKELPPSYMESLEPDTDDSGPEDGDDDDNTMRLPIAVEMSRDADGQGFTGQIFTGPSGKYDH